MRIFKNRKTLLLRYFYLYDNIIYGLDKTVGVICRFRMMKQLAEEAADQRRCI